MLARLALKNVIQRPLRYALTGFAIIVGVASVVAVFTFSSGLRETFDRLSGDIECCFDVEVRRVSPLGPNVAAPPVDIELAEELEGLDFVQEIQPIIIDFGTVAIDGDEELLLTNGPPNIGSNWESRTTTPRNFITEGREPEAADEFVMDVDAFASGNFEIGERYAIAARGSLIREFELVGIYNFGDEDQNRTVGAILLAFTEDTALEFLNDSEGYDSITVTGFDVESDDDFADQIKEALNAEENNLEVLTQAEKAEETQSAFGQIVTIFSTVLIVFAVIILFVSAYLIYNVFSITVAQRVRELSLLRSIGAKGRQITNMMLGEALVMGIFATIIGIPAGLGLSVLLREGLEQADFPGDIDLSLTSSTIILAIFIGVFVTLAAALVPAIKARQVTPIDGLSENPSTDDIFSPNRLLAGISSFAFVVLLGLAVLLDAWSLYLLAPLAAAIFLYMAMASISQTTKRYAGVGVFVFGVILLLIALFTSSGVAETFALIGAGAVAALIGASQASARLAGIISRGVGSPFGAVVLLLIGIALALSALANVGFGIAGAVNGDGIGILIVGLISALITGVLAYLAIRTAIASFGVPGRLGRLNVARNAQRTATTATALMIGVTLIATVSVVGESIRQSVNEALDSTIQADLLVASQSNDASQGGFSSELISEIQGIEGVETIEAWRSQFVSSRAIYPNGTISDTQVANVSQQILSLEGNAEEILDIESEFDVNVVQHPMLGINTSAFDTHVDFGFTEYDESLAESTEIEPIFLTEDIVEDLGVGVGDSYYVITNSGVPVEFTVAGVFTDEFLASGSQLIPLSSWNAEDDGERRFPDIDSFLTVTVDADSGYELADLESRLDSDAYDEFVSDNDEPSDLILTTEVVQAEVQTVIDEKSPTTQVQDKQEVSQEASDQINQVLITINSLLALAGLIALLSITIALSLSVFERTREIGLMRAVGTTRPQLRRTIRWEGAIIAVFGAIVGLILGLGFGLLASSKMPEELVSVVRVPWPTVVVVLVVAMIFGLIAALFPAWRAGRMNVLDAISHD